MGSFMPTMPAGTLNVALSNFAKEYRNNALVGDLIAPRVPVDRQAFQYVIFDRGNQRNDRNTLRAPGAAPQSIRRTFSTGAYFCKDHALSSEIPFESEKYALGLGFSEQQKATQTLIDRILLDREISIAALATNPANVPNALALSGTSQWDYHQGWSPLTPAANTSNPIENVEAAKAIVRQSGVAANIFIISDPVFVALKTHPEIRDYFKYSQSGPITLDDISAVLGIKTVLASAIVLDDVNVASWVWGTNAVLAYSQTVADMEDLSAIKTFVWTAAPDTSDGYGVILEPKYPLSTKAMLVSNSMYYDLKITGPETLYLFSNVCAAPVMAPIAAPVEG